MPWMISGFFAWCVAASAGSFAEDAMASDGPPNIMVILADDLGFSDIGCYGGEIATPNLDALARGGLRFTQFYNTARCWPTRAALLTGYYGQQVRRDTIPGVPSGSQGVRPAWARLVPEMLRQAGYRSYHSGKWHVDGPRLAGGFDRSYCIEDHNRYFAPQNQFKDDVALPPVRSGDGYYVTTAIAGHAIECLKEHSIEHRGKPFFQFVAFTAPHFPLQAPADDIARYRDRYLRGWDTVRHERWRRLTDFAMVHHPLPPLERDVGPPYHFPDALAALGPGELNRPLPWDELTAEQRSFQATKMAIHAAMIDRMDREIGRLMEQLRNMNAFDNTVIFFLSDNGASAEIMVRGDGHDRDASPGSAQTFLCLGPGWSSAANTPLRRHKTWVYEGGIATPLIVHWPVGISARGELRRSPGHVIDVVPTILELTGARRFERWNDEPVATPPGKSLVSALRSDVVVPRDYLWWLHEGNRALRVGDWKAVAAGQNSPWELYDLDTDRGETIDRAAEQPDRLSTMTATWQGALDQFREQAK